MRKINTQVEGTGHKLFTSSETVVYSILWILVFQFLTVISDLKLYSNSNFESNFLNNLCSLIILKSKTLEEII